MTKLPELRPVPAVLRWLLGSVLTLSAMAAEPPVPSSDETSAPPYTLPDPLVFSDGHRVRDAAAWESRRGELLELFAREVYGRTPLGRPGSLRAEVTSIERQALDGLAIRKQIRLACGSESDAPVLHLLLYVPHGAKGRRPALLGLNFYGNHTVHPDPGIELPAGWLPDKAPGAVAHRASDQGRGGEASKWPVELLLRRGYAVATMYCGDLCPDRPDGLEAGVNGWFAHTGTETRAPDAWGAIGVWAWGLSRALDYLSSDEDIDAARVAVHGHSRLGKAALWAAAQDRRFALAISNESGCGGAALSKRIHGETVAKINAMFPHWFARNFRQYDENEAALPVDQHELLALIAPRPLYVASAEDDDWADPRGEYLSVQAAAPVYRLLGQAAGGLDSPPPVSTPVGDVLRYHLRPGEHDLKLYDWSQYLDFADRWLRRAGPPADSR